MKLSSRINRKGIAIAFVLFVVIILGMFLVTMTFTRTERKRQTRQSINHIKAHYFARGALQHALLKIRLLPNEVFDASCLQRGICPFYRFKDSDAVEAGDNKFEFAMDDFREDLNTNTSNVNNPGVPIESTGGDYTGWSYETPTMQAIASVLRDDSIVQVIEITVKSIVPDPKPGEPERIEIIKKTLEIEQKRS